MNIQKVEHAARRDGRPVITYKIRYKERVLDPATGQPTGQQRSRSETYPTYEAARERRREIENQRAATGAVVGREARLEPFGTFAALWVREAQDAVALGDLKQRTATDRADVLRRYVLPQWASRPVGGITKPEASEFRSGLVARGLAPATVKAAYDTFRRVLEIAVDNGTLSTNPAELRRKAGTRSTRHAAGFTHHPLSREQLAAVTRATRSELDALMVLFLAYTGVRAAEFAGLNVGDLELGSPGAPPSSSTGGAYVRVHRTRQRVGGAWREDTPKSAKSTRRVPLPAELAERLRTYLTVTHPRAAEPDAPLWPGRLPGGHTHGRQTDRTRPTGTPNWTEPVEPSLFYKNVLKPALRAAGLPVSAPGVKGVRLHDLRHTFATLALDAGHDYREVSEWLGHADYTTTLRTYAHWLPGDARNSMQLPDAPAPATAPTSTSNVVDLASRRKTG